MGARVIRVTVLEQAFIDTHEIFDKATSNTGICFTKV